MFVSLHIHVTLAGSFGRCLNTRPDGLVFKQLPRDPANVNARKNMCDPYTHLCNETLTYWIYTYCRANQE